MNPMIEKLRKYTLIKPARAEWLVNRWGEIEYDNIPGAIVECGCWRGGMIALLGYVTYRDLWAFDLFDRLDLQASKDELIRPVENKAATMENVTRAFEIAKVKPLWYRIVAGDIALTGPQVAPVIGPIALLCLDMDWYKPTLAALNALYGQVASGGGIYVDDYYCWPGCKKAVREFWGTHGAVTYRIHRPAIFWRKP